MKILFLHQNFPGQFVHLAQSLRRDPANEVCAVTDAVNPRRPFVTEARYTFTPERAGRPHRLARSFAGRVARGEAAAVAMRELRDKGFEPDVVIGHLGWGETLFVKDVWPKTKLIVLAEFFYRSEGADSGFDPEFVDTDETAARMAIRVKNAAILLAMESADFGVASTWWQGSRFPPELRGKIAILHEGIDTDRVAPNPDARFRHAALGLDFTRRNEIVTFVNRNLEPYRGYHIFMRALPEILAARPWAHVLIIGGDATSYGPHAPDGKTWKDIFLAEVVNRLPMDRVHFVGKLPWPDYLAALQISSAHVYLTYPFVLSWSMLEAMSAGAPLVASRTAPVTEVARDGETAVLFDFFDKDALANRVIEVLTETGKVEAMRERARAAIVERFDLRRVCLPKWVAFIRKVAAGA
jgi:glycosyltransferase involved in cell wall biosynthesis